MLLKEFFGRNIDIKQTSDKKDNSSKKDDLFWYILDHDKLHKDYFMPLGRKIRHDFKEGSTNERELIKGFMPMVNKGCLEYMLKNKIQGDHKKIFDKEIREELCQKLYDHYKDDIIKGKYKI